MRYLTALAEEKHFAKAAARSFVSQPTLSIAIKKLEDNLNIIIFEREKHQVVVTPLGEQIIQQAYQILNEASELLAIAESGQNPYLQPLRVGAIFTIGPYIFPGLVQKLVADGSQLRLALEENYTQVLTDKLLARELDVIILATEVNHPEVEQEVVGKDILDIICAKNNPLVANKKLKAEDLTDETFILLGQGNCFRDQVLQICPQYNPGNNQFANLITTSSLETVKYMVEMNLGISMLPRIAQNQLPKELVVRSLSHDKLVPYREISLAYRKNFQRKELIDVIKERLIVQLATTTN